MNVFVGISLIFPSFLLIAAVSVPKKKRKMKELNKKEAVGDLLDAFKEVCVRAFSPVPICYNECTAVPFVPILLRIIEVPSIIANRK